MMYAGAKVTLFSIQRVIGVTVGNISRQFTASATTFCENESYTDIEPETRGFLKAQKTLRAILDSETPSPQHVASPPREAKSFAELFKQSPMVKLGNFSNQTVIGKIVARVDNELYIDYGGKFDCVCRVPQPKSAKWSNSSREDVYKVGSNVVIKVRDHEMAARFMGYDTDLTLLEADAQLVGIAFGEKDSA